MASTMRYKIASVINDIGPTPAVLGPPLPEYFGVYWPKNVQARLTRIEALTDAQIKRWFIKLIQGR